MCDYQLSQLFIEGVCSSFFFFETKQIMCVVLYAFLIHFIITVPYMLPYLILVPTTCLFKTQCVYNLKQFLSVEQNNNLF